MYVVKRSNKKGKKWMVTLPNGKSVHYGAKGYEDYTIHNDLERKKRYLKRHGGMNQDWTKKGINTPGYWSRWHLWNKPSSLDSLQDIADRFNINIIYKD